MAVDPNLGNNIRNQVQSKLAAAGVGNRQPGGSSAMPGMPPINSTSNIQVNRGMDVQNTGGRMEVGNGAMPNVNFQDMLNRVTQNPGIQQMLDTIQGPPPGAGGTGGAQGLSNVLQQGISQFAPGIQAILDRLKGGLPEMPQIPDGRQMAMDTTNSVIGSLPPELRAAVQRRLGSSLQGQQSGVIQ